MLEKYNSVNVFGKELRTCCNNPRTGFFRNGICDTCKEDQGVHTVCILATQEFLDFSKSVGNDLSTPQSEFQSSGVKSGDRWCLCAARWEEAYDNGISPPIFLESTHIETLNLVDINLLQQYTVN